MFVSTEQKRRNPILYFFNDKTLLTGSISERDVRPVLDCSVNPKGSVAYKTIFDMTEEKNFVTKGGEYTLVTPAQKQLLQFINGYSLDLADWLKDALERATYLCEFDVTPEQLRGDYHLLQLQENIQAISNEIQSNSYLT